VTEKKNQAYPAGWDEERIRKLAEHYDNQTEDEQVADHERLFWQRGRLSWSCPPNWFRRSSSSSARNGPHRTMIVPLYSPRSKRVQRRRCGHAARSSTCSSHAIQCCADGRNTSRNGADRS